MTVMATEAKSMAKNGTNAIAAKQGIKQLAVAKKLMHGFMHESEKKWKAPVMVRRCEEAARPGYNTMKAHEYTEVSNSMCTNYANS